MTNFLLANLRELPDSTLIDSLASLPRGQTIPAKYFGTVVYEVARQKPNSYFRVADAFPSNWSIIFGAVQHDKSIVKSLRKAEGNPKTKDAFFKEYKSMKWGPIAGIGTLLVGGGLLILMLTSS